MYPHNQKCLKELKYSFTRQILEPIYLHDKRTANAGIFQGFGVQSAPLETGTENLSCRGRSLGGPVELATARLYSGSNGAAAA